ncbi:MAG: lipopolysaccharide heptosyltransferase I [Acidobacteriota bacterium]|nr:lipopolysaccharide heptosyltransferase I [Acidobacteriota bacterium]
MRLLFVKLGSIGDVVHTLPALAAVRRALPDAEISWAVEGGAAEILRDNPLLESAIEVDTKALRRAPVSGETLSATRRQLRRLRASPFDLVLDFQGLLKSALIARLSGARRTVGFARPHLREPASRFLLSETFAVPPRSNVIRKNLALVAAALKIDVPDDADEFEFTIATNPEHAREAESVIRETAAPFAILNPGGGWATKLWGAERYGQLADELLTRHGLRSLVTHGPGEAELAARVAASSRLNAARPVSLSLKGFYELARRAQVYVGGDTGPTHIAVAAGAPVVGIFGPTEWWRNGSPRREDIEAGRTDISCRVDCHRRTCSNWVCMEIEVARVADAVTERLRRAGASKRSEVLTIA